MKKKNYIFTNKNHPARGIMSTILGILAWGVILTAIYLTYQNGGTANLRYGAGGLLAAVFGAAGLTLGILSRMERDKYYLFSYAGIVLNAVIMILIGWILYVGVMGI